METDPKVFSGVLVSDLETFLSGMETGQGPRQDQGPGPALKPSLVEWKLKESERNEF